MTKYRTVQQTVRMQPRLQQRLLDLAEQENERISRVVVGLIEDGLKFREINSRIT